MVAPRSVAWGCQAGATRSAGTGGPSGESRSAGGRLGGSSQGSPPGRQARRGSYFTVGKLGLLLGGGSQVLRGNN